MIWQQVKGSKFSVYDCVLGIRFDSLKGGAWENKGNKYKKFNTTQEIITAIMAPQRTTQ